MKTLKEYITEAEEKKIAIGHFNFANLETLWAIVNIGRQLELPVIVGTSEGERRFIGPKQAVALVRSIREEFDYPVFLNADHTYSLDGVKEAVAAGYDAIIYDGSKKVFKTNVEETKEAVDYVKSKNPDILVEGELGYIGTSSKLLASIPDGVKTDEASLTKPEEAAQFVKDTGVDLFSGAVGSIHGRLMNAPNPALDIDRIQAIRNAIPIPMVLHGGSGTSEQDFRRAPGSGISIIHISTDLRIAYRDTLREMINKFPDELSPYKIMENVVYEIEKVVEIKMKMFANMD